MPSRSISNTSIEYCVEYKIPKKFGFAQVLGPQVHCFYFTICKGVKFCVHSKLCADIVLFV